MNVVTQLGGLSNAQVLTLHKYQTNSLTERSITPNIYAMLKRRTFSRMTYLLWESWRLLWSAASPPELAVWPSSPLHLQEAMFDSLSTEMPAWQAEWYHRTRGRNFSFSVIIKGCPPTVREWKVRFNVLTRVAGEERLKALHAAFWVGHSSPCSEWDVPVEFAIDCLKERD